VSDTTLRLAEACERAMAYAQYIATERIVDLAQSEITNYGLLSDAERVRQNAKDDVEYYRALAAALRGAKQIVTHEGNTLTALELETT